jgi:dihydrolipoamide dehydrogenase
MIAELGLGMTLETTYREILDTVHAHPTLSEAVAEAAGVAYGEALNI